MSVTGSNNPFSCSPVVFSAGNSIISLGTITRVGNVFTFSVGFVWEINGVTYQNSTPIDLTITEATEGYFRIDNALLNTSNTIELQQGLPSNSIAIRPTYPETNILLTSWNISGTTIGDEEVPILGASYVKKSFAKDFQFNGSGSNAVIPLNPDGYSDIRLTNAGLVSVSGIDLSLMTGPNFEAPYQGKQFVIWNETGSDVAFKHDDTSNSDYVFQLKDALDIIVPDKNFVRFYYDGALWELDKSFQTQKFFDIVSNTTLSAIHNNSVLRIKSNATVTIQTGMPSDFNFVVAIYAGVTYNQVAGSGVTQSPSTVSVIGENMLTTFVDGTNNYQTFGM